MLAGGAAVGVGSRGAAVGVGGRGAAVGAPPVNEPVWLDPAPRDLCDATPASPEAAISAHQSLELAFLTLLQRLPAPQRAALLLRDVLGFSAVETAELLDMTVAATNSTLQRARAALDAARSTARGRTRHDDGTIRTLLRRYIEAWESGAPDRFASVLRDDVLFTMPPIPSWFVGMPAVVGIAAWLRVNLGELRCIEAWAAGRLGAACYLRAPGESVFRPATLHVLSWDDERVAEIHAFGGPPDFARHGLPTSLPATTTSWS
jgi:RNA polymerase sigma-70 factor (ECF subfamily)